MLWEIDIYPAPGQPDRLALQAAAGAAELGIAQNLQVVAATGYLIEGRLDRGQRMRLNLALQRRRETRGTKHPQPVLGKTLPCG